MDALPVRGRVSPDDEAVLKHLSFWKRRAWKKSRAQLPPGGMVTVTAMPGRVTIETKVCRCRPGDRRFIP